jgi:hypothetical protein
MDLSSSRLSNWRPEVPGPWPKFFEACGGSKIKVSEIDFPGDFGLPKNGGVLISSPHPVIPRQIALQQSPASVSRDDARVAVTAWFVKFGFSWKVRRPSLPLAAYASARSKSIFEPLRLGGRSARRPLKVTVYRQSSRPSCPAARETHAAAGRRPAPPWRESLAQRDSRACLDKAGPAAPRTAPRPTMLASRRSNLASRQNLARGCSAWPPVRARVPPFGWCECGPRHRWWK